MNFPEEPTRTDTQSTIEVYRVLDANCNRLREALRVLEEHFRFFENCGEDASEIKLLRHSLKSIISQLGQRQLLAARDTANDCFANKNRPEELERKKPDDILAANFKRAQEAARVIEEYSKLTPVSTTSETAKTIRFSLYTLEQRIFIR